MDIPEKTTQSQPISKHEYKGNPPSPKEKRQKGSQNKIEEQFE